MKATLSAIVFAAVLSNGVEARRQRDGGAMCRWVSNDEDVRIYGRVRYFDGAYRNQTEETLRQGMFIKNLADGDNYSLQISNDFIADVDAFECGNIDITQFTQYATFSVANGIGRTWSCDINEEMDDGSDGFIYEEADDMDQRIAAVLDAENNIEACCILDYTAPEDNDGEDN